MPPTLLVGNPTSMAPRLTTVKRIGALAQQCLTQSINRIQFDYRRVQVLTREPIIATTCMGFLGNTVLVVDCSCLQVAQMAAQDFANIRLGHFINKGNLSGTLVTGHLLFAILNDLSLS